MSRESQAIEANPDAASPDDIRSTRFAELAKTWQDETLYLSSPVAKAGHPAYREIIAMGRPAIALIMAEMEKRPGHWFAALRALSGEDPTPDEVGGNVRAMTAVWLDWGKAHGYR